MSKLTIGFAGMTHLGTCSSVGASLYGNNVVAFDMNDELIKKRKQGEFDKAEPGIEEFLKELPSNFHLTVDVFDLKKCDLVMISVDSPVDEFGNVDTGPVAKLFELVAKNIDCGIPIIILSQIRPGFTRLVSESRQEIYYQMETLIFGQGLQRALKPERYVIGQRNESQPLNPSYEKFLKQGNCPILKMSFESAELAKLSANFFLASSITATNTLAALSSKLGANWQQIADSLKLDRRIGPYAYIKAGLGIGGSNIIRDLVGIREMSNMAGTDASIVDAMLTNSEFSKNWLIRQLLEVVHEIKSPKIGILGLSYKQNTDSTIGSSGVNAAKIFSEYYPIYVYDPAVKENRDINDSVGWCNSAPDVISKVNILVISTEWDEFKTEKFSKILWNSEIRCIIDPFGCLSKTMDKNDQINYRTLGVSAKKGQL